MIDEGNCREDDSRNDGGSNDSLDDRPKYVQVRDALIERIRSGAWKSGQLIPSEPEIAREFDVAPGTARRALGMLVEIGLLKRRHGSGTWVQDDQSERYRFLSLYDHDNMRIPPHSRDVRSAVARANARERSKLGLPDK